MERTDIGDFNGLGTMEMNAMRYVEVLESFSTSATSFAVTAPRKDILTSLRARSSKNSVAE